MRIQPRPELSVIVPFESTQYLAGDRLLSPMRFWPSFSWPREPEAPPEAVRWKQQPSLRPIRALVPAAKAARVKKLFMVASECGGRAR